ncbi:AAA-like domain-containing protein [Methylobacterium sp. 174MFSha1.1]|uniref:ATP-binding protein n=1 Tax=Methylobacterium sp. 174MFSha1.1 TaxID=1502749 RepID=UPI0008F006CB|nr:ATP-binding protein [Methylobacterium sp. 174MFSha1.1]SFU62794.1 AAA-like domain-containing protein [Methylobacterium sp. 174MFSha1.1]
MSDALDALRRVNFDWVRTLDSVWLDAEPTGAPNEALIPGIIEALHAQTAGSRPRGRVLVGDPGIGKTHLVGQIRREVWRSQGWFVLLDVLGLSDFWRSAALSYLTALMQPMPDGRRQSDAVLAGVARRFKVEEQVEQAFNTPNIDTRKIVDLLVKALMHVDSTRALNHRDVFRALCLLRSQDLNAVGLAHAWLQGYDADPAARAALGFTMPPPPPIDLVRGMAWIMGLSGPTLVALDQIDGVVDAGRLTLDDDFEAGPAPTLAEVLVSGLMQLHDGAGRGMTLITCLSDSWRSLQERGLKSAMDRFEQPVGLKGMNKPAAAAALIRDRLAPAYAEAGFTPPSPIWPFSEAAITAAAHAAMRPRTLLMRCDAFRRDCLTGGAVTICNDLTDALPKPLADNPFSDFDLDAARRTADITGILDDEDAGLGELLRTAFDLYALEDDPHDAIDVVSKGEPEQKLPPLHGRLTFLHRDENDRERHVCYRALLQPHPIAFQARLRAALTASGISSRIPGRELLVVRRGPVPAGTKTGTLVSRFVAAGGKLIDPSDDDLRTFVALRTLRDAAVRDGQSDRFESWMRTTLPVRGTGFFRQIGLSGDGAEPGRRGRAPLPPLPPRQPRREIDPPTGDPELASVQVEPANPPYRPAGAEPAMRVEAMHVEAMSVEAARARRAVPAHAIETVTRIADTLPAGPTAPPQAQAPERPAPEPRAEPVPDAIPVGHRLTPDAPPVALPLRLLPRHTAIIAGSGSGKTVLLRRLVEEAALAGIPAIVVDPNNDLSRLGDPWPERPEKFTPEDDRKAAAYAERVEVVVWTPGVHAGNPLFLSVMPDLAASDDRDERAQAIEMATETLGPLAGATRTLQRGVLADALRAFAARGGGTLAAFTGLLADLPDGTSQIGRAQTLAAAMADQLLAAVATNPLLRVEGAVLDPARLFFGPDRRRTRISVVNLSGLASDAAREDFVNRLQMALFGWIKQNPSPRGLLYVVDEAQTFLPSGRTPPSLGSGIKLVAQGRKYGLGMIVATQVPKGIHNQVVSNCTTQFFGRQSAPATIAAAQEIMAASGGAASDLGRLGAGEFYFATEGSGKPAKLRTPLCLSHHPANPPAPHEVVARARRSAGPER